MRCTLPPCAAPHICRALPAGLRHYWITLCRASWVLSRGCCRYLVSCCAHAFTCCLDSAELNAYPFLRRSTSALWVLYSPHAAFFSPYDAGYVARERRRCAATHVSPLPYCAFTPFCSTTNALHCGSLPSTCSVPAYMPTLPAAHSTNTLPHARYAFSLPCRSLSLHGLVVYATSFAPALLMVALFLITLHSPLPATHAICHTYAPARILCSKLHAACAFAGYCCLLRLHHHLPYGCYDRLHIPAACITPVLPPAATLHRTSPAALDLYLPLLRMMIVYAPFCRCRAHHASAATARLFCCTYLECAITLGDGGAAARCCGCAAIALPAARRCFLHTAHVSHHKTPAGDCRHYCCLPLYLSPAAMTTH